MPHDLEKKLRLAMEKEADMRIMDDFVVNRKISEGYARWESALHTKDRAAERRRLDHALIEDVSFQSNETKLKRKEKLMKMYADDDEKYEAELLERGLTFRREKI